MPTSRRSIACIVPLACTIILQACATTRLEIGPGTALAPGSKTQATKGMPLSSLPPTDQITARSDLDSEFSDVLVTCKSVLSAFESQSQRLRYLSLAIALVGAISGGVVVPALTAGGAAANAATIAAFGGVSGVANTAQTTMTQLGLTSEEAIKVREAIRRKWDDAMDDYFKAADSTDPYKLDKMTVALQKAKVACINYALSNPSVTVEKKP